jgi:hypothetical protein
MNGKINTPRTVCKAIVAVAIAAIAVAAIIGCSSLGGGSRRQSIATVIQTAYDLGGREAVSNKIESLVREGKLSPTQGARLHALAQLAYEGVMDDLSPATNAAPASASPSGCGGCSVPDASTGCGGGGCTDGQSDSQEESGAESAGVCNEDARCGKCEYCRA